MRATVVVFVAVAVAAMASAAVVQEPFKRSKRGAESVRVRIQEERINRLSNLVSELEDLLEAQQGGDAHEVLIGLQTRLDSQFGSTCAEGQFQCGGDTRQCVSGLEVCDGVSDCSNNHDEVADTCTNLAETGSSWTGGRVSDACTNRKAYEMQVVFESSNRKDWFPARVGVNANVILKSKNLQSTSVAALPTTGSYNFASRSVYLQPPEEDGLALEMVFETGSRDSVDVFVVREASGERCAQFVLFRD